MIVEINGVKLELDERQARTIETYHVGDSVKVLTKQYSDWKVGWGVIVGFANFKDLPSIEVLMAVDPSYSFTEIRLITINAETKDVQLAPATEYEPAFRMDAVIDRLNREIKDLADKQHSLETRKAAFIKYFGKESSDATKTDA